MPILKLKQHDPEKELEFELTFQGNLSVAERFQMIQDGCLWLLKQQIKNGQKKAFEIIKRR